MRGYNTSSKPPGIKSYYMDPLMADVRGLIDFFGAKKATIVAHDWGGVIAHYLAAYYPELVEKLVILNAPHPMAFIRELGHNIRQIKSFPDGNNPSCSLKALVCVNITPQADYAAGRYRSTILFLNVIQGQPHGMKPPPYGIWISAVIRHLHSPQQRIAVYLHCKILLVEFLENLSKRVNCFYS